MAFCLNYGKFTSDWLLFRINWNFNWLISFWEINESKFIKTCCSFWIKIISFRFDSILMVCYFVLRKFNAQSWIILSYCFFSKRVKNDFCYLFKSTPIWPSRWRNVLALNVVFVVTVVACFLVHALPILLFHFGA